MSRFCLICCDIILTEHQSKSIYVGTVGGSPSGSIQKIRGSLRSYEAAKQYVNAHFVGCYTAPRSVIHIVLFRAGGEKSNGYNSI